MTEAEERVARARGLVGVRFRAQGRDPAHGLDCVGLALRAAGLPAEAVRRDYVLRGVTLETMEAGLRRLGFGKVAAERAGDVLLCQAGPGQLHLLLWTGNGFVHADAGLRRVAERPGRPLWPVAGIWRPAAEGGE